MNNPSPPNVVCLPFHGELEAKFLQRRAYALGPNLVQPAVALLAKTSQRTKTTVGGRGGERRV